MIEDLWIRHLFHNSIDSARKVQVVGIFNFIPVDWGSVISRQCWSALWLHQTTMLLNLVVIAGPIGQNESMAFPASHWPPFLHKFKILEFRISYFRQRTHQFWKKHWAQITFSIASPWQTHRGPQCSRAHGTWRSPSQFIFGFCLKFH